jgi:hypothetical protein
VAKISQLSAHLGSIKSDKSPSAYFGDFIPIDQRWAGKSKT